MNSVVSVSDYKRILLAVADQQLGECIQGWLEDELKSYSGRLLIHPVRDEANAWRYLNSQSAKQPCDLVITQVSIPANRNSPRNDKENRGLELVRNLTSPTSSILIAPVVDANLYDKTHAFYNCTPVAADQELDKRLIRYAQAKLDATLDRSAEERVRVTFTFNADNPHGCAYSIVGLGFSYDKAGSIQIDPKTMSDLFAYSKMASGITEYPSWAINLEKIGETLVQKLFLDNLVAYWYGKVSAHKTEIVFDIARSVHPVIFEALVDPATMERGPEAGGKAFWMLTAPIYRRLRNEAPTDRYPLFQGWARQGPVNCLIIESQVDGLVPALKDGNGEPLTLESLPNVPRESRWLEDYLKENRQKFGLGQILRISPDRVDDREVNRSGESTMKAWVRAELNRSDLDWHLVHYAGHCHYDEARAKGYVFFPGEAFVEELELRFFSASLSRTRFVYLSGCNSSEENFVFELADNHVPAVLGFRWKIEDEPAAQYTEAFYKQLFEVHQNLEYAFFQARLQLRETCERKRTWAAPMLIMQLSKSYGGAS